MPFISNPTTTTRRDEAGSMTLPVPSKTRLSATENAQKEVLECGGNVQLMEARLCQITSSMRALLRSNQDLEEALQSNPNDPDFLQAIAENKLTLHRQGHVAAALVKELQANGTHVEMEHDIHTALVNLNQAISASQGETMTNNNDANNQGGTDSAAEAGGGLYL